MVRQNTRVKPSAKGLIFIVSGPSGSGKTTLLKGVLKSSEFKDNLKKTLSLTTRPRRKGELEGKDYEFVDKNEFLTRLKHKEILEHTKYVRFYYGTSKKNIEQIIFSGKNDCLMCLDTQGAFNIRKIYPRRARLIFILPPSINVLQFRLKKRGRESKKELDKRISLFKNEIAMSKKYDYIIINNKVKDAVGQLSSIIKNERLTSSF